MKKHIKWVVIGGVALIVLLCMLIGIFSGGKEEPPTAEQSNEEQVRQTIEASNKQTAQAIPTSTPEIISTLEPLDQIRNLLADELGESNREIQRITSVDWVDEWSEIQITFTANDNLFGIDSIYRGIQTDIIEILNIIQSSNTSFPYESVCVIATFPLVDTYGNETESNVVLATFSRENLDKVNWDNFLTDNLFEIAKQEESWIHPEFKN